MHTQICHDSHHYSCNYTGCTTGGGSLSSFAFHVPSSLTIAPTCLSNLISTTLPGLLFPYLHISKSKTTLNLLMAMNSCLLHLRLMIFLLTPDRKPVYTVAVNLIWQLPHAGFYFKSVRILFCFFPTPPPITFLIVHS